MARPRFYAPQARTVGQRLLLPDEEARHATRTLRLGLDARVRVFDGHGQEFEARVAEVTRRTVTVELVEARPPGGEPGVVLTLAQAVLKGRAFDAVVRDATMLGVQVIQPLVTVHTDVPKAAVRGNDWPARWHRMAVAATKQSGGTVLPEIRPVRPFDELLVGSDERHIMLVEPSQHDTAPSTRSWRADTPPARATLLIGPEGGWAPPELAAARERDVEMLTLGGRTLRADAAPLVAITVLRFAWGDL